MLDVAEPYKCQDCPLLDCRGLRPLEKDQREYMQTIKQGEKLFERGDTILREEEEVRHLYTVLDGVLIRYRSLEDGRRQIVNFMFPGDLVGLQGAFDEPSSHSVEVLIPAREFKNRHASIMLVLDATTEAFQSLCKASCA